jgi:outer membrane receptor protein involved in Fe transport
MSNPGTIESLSGEPWQIPGGQDGKHLTVSNLIEGHANLRDVYQHADILPSQEQTSVAALFRQLLSPDVFFFGDLLFSRRRARVQADGVAASLLVPASNPNYVNPDGGRGPVRVDYNFFDDLGPVVSIAQARTWNVTSGLTITMPGDWRSTVYAQFAQEVDDLRSNNQINYAALDIALADKYPDTAFNAFGAGSHTNPKTLAAIRGERRFAMSSALRIMNFATNGPVCKLPADPLMLALGTEYRDQTLYTRVNEDASPSAPHSLGRKVVAAFGEVMLPLVGKNNRHPGVRELSFSLAGRYEHSNDFGYSATPKAGLTWSPLPSVSFRGTWSQSIRAPDLEELSERRNSSGVLSLPDPSSSTGMRTTLLWVGNNAALRAERATSWTAGIDFTPSALPQLKALFTYFDVTFRDRIDGAPFAYDLLSNPRHTDIVTVHPTSGEIEYVCSHSTFTGSISNNCNSSSIDALADLRLHNESQLHTNGIDFVASYAPTIPVGVLNLRVEGTYLLGYSIRQTPNSAPQPLLNTQNNPIDLRLRGSIGWQIRALRITARANFANSYRDMASDPPKRVGSWTTYDATVPYEFGNFAAASGRGMQLKLGIRNLLNSRPPFLNNQIARLGYDQENADPEGRVLQVQLAARW